MNTNTSKLPFVLYEMQSCPFCFVVRSAITRLDLDVERRDIYQQPEYKEELVAGGGKQQVPCLHIIDPDGGTEWLYESKDIIEYLAHYKQTHLDAA